MTTHIPVLRKEVIQYLNPKPDENFIDATIGFGGHALSILERIAPSGKLLGIDWDPIAIQELAEKIKNTVNEKRIILVNDNFTNLSKIVKEKEFFNIRGILADLGLSSMMIEERSLGFSFLRDEPLDMRFDAYPKIKNQSRIKYGTKIKNFLTAQDIVNKYNERELAEIFWEYGEERFAGSIAQKIIKARQIRPIKTTFQLVEIIKQATPSWYHHRRIHPATKSFQALRIAVNNELENLKSFLDQALDVLEEGGRLVIISFHSLEDKIVKDFFRQNNKQGLIKILTKKVIRPAFEEIQKNPRSRSARLRAVIKI